MNELISIKGANSGLQLLINEDVAKTSFLAVQQAITAKLSASANFFTKNTPIYWVNPSYPEHQQKILTATFKQYDLILKIVTKEEAEDNFKYNKTNDLPDKIIKRTIRGGEEIIYKGSIIIYGNVNPGAKIISGKNIDIHGICRGIVHAGAFGNVKAFVVADKLAPLQIRIADFIARQPDKESEIEMNMKLRHSNMEAMTTEIAMIKEGNIILEPFTR